MNWIAALSFGLDATRRLFFIRVVRLRTSANFMRLSLWCFGLNFCLLLCIASIILLFL